MAVDWVVIRNEYINGNLGYRKLAKKYGIPFNTLRTRAKNEKWPKLREKQQHKIGTELAQKTAAKIARQEAKRAARIQAASDELLTKIERAILELDQTQVKSTRKTKTVEYKDLRAAGKPTKEVIEEIENLITVQSIIDRKGLQQVAMALKSVWDMSEKEDETEEVEDDGLLDALGENAKNLFADGDDSAMLPKEKET